MVRTVKSRYEDILKTALHNEKVREYVRKIVDESTDTTRHVAQLLSLPDDK